MPMKIVTHDITETDLDREGVTPCIVVEGYRPSWWTKVKNKLRSENIEPLYNHSRSVERRDLRRND